MSFNVRVFGYRGVRQLTQVNPRQVETDTMSVLVQPHEWAQLLDLDDQGPVSTAAVPNDQATCIRIEVPAGQKVRYEVNNINRAGGMRIAGAHSPMLLSAYDVLDWGSGWTVSLVDAARFP